MISKWLNLFLGRSHVQFSISINSFCHPSFFLSFLRSFLL